MPPGVGPAPAIGNRPSPRAIPAMIDTKRFI
jgi:hypothetical protein